MNYIFFLRSNYVFLWTSMDVDTTYFHYVVKIPFDNQSGTYLFTTYWLPFHYLSTTFSLRSENTFWQPIWHLPTSYHFTTFPQPFYCIFCRRITFCYSSLKSFKVLLSMKMQLEPFTKNYELTGCLASSLVVDDIFILPVCCTYITEGKLKWGTW